MKSPKPVKAWAVTFDGKTVPDACFTEQCAAKDWADNYRGGSMTIDVIECTVLITPIPPKRKRKAKR